MRLLADEHFRARSNNSDAPFQALARPARSYATRWAGATSTGGSALPPAALPQKSGCAAFRHAERSEASRPGRFAALSVTAFRMLHCLSPFFGDLSDDALRELVYQSMVTGEGA